MGREGGSAGFMLVLPSCCLAPSPWLLLASGGLWLMLAPLFPLPGCPSPLCLLVVRVLCCGLLDGCWWLGGAPDCLGLLLVACSLVLVLGGDGSPGGDEWLLSSLGMNCAMLVVGE